MVKVIINQQGLGGLIFLSLSAVLYCLEEHGEQVWSLVNRPRAKKPCSLSLCPFWINISAILNECDMKGKWMTLIADEKHLTAEQPEGCCEGIDPVTTGHWGRHAIYFSKTWDAPYCKWELPSLAEDKYWNWLLVRVAVSEDRNILLFFVILLSYIENLSQI